MGPCEEKKGLKIPRGPRIEVLIEEDGTSREVSGQIDEIEDGEMARLRIQEHGYPYCPDV